MLLYKKSLLMTFGTTLVIYQRGQPGDNLALPSQLAHLNSTPSLLYHVIVYKIFTIQMYSTTSVDKYKKKKRYSSNERIK